MTQSRYDAATAKALMALAHGECKDEATAPYIQREGGLYVNESFRAVCPPGTIFDWTPADDMEWPGSPNPDTAPFLPIPFTASELAACMLDGPGQSIQFALDKRIGYPLKDGALGAIPARHRWMREALQEAYEIAAAAQLVVGEFDHEEEARAHALAQQYDDANGQANEREGVFEQGITRNEAHARRARAVASVADLKAQTERAQAAVADKWKAWRKAMVRQLLLVDSRRSYIAQKLEEMQSDEHKKSVLVADAVFERWEIAQLKLKRRLAILDSGPPFCVPIEVAEADVENAKREVAEAEHEMRFMRGDFDGSKPMSKESGQPAHDDFSMLATREQLIEAFGRFTGMDASWFKNITDTPVLLAARKVAGHGGRGHIAEPLFCPFEVMQWLADSKRRKNKSRKLSVEKAWELLEKNFPKVYNARSIADPRTGD